ncbi:MAG: prephenate dehydratase [Bacteroidales bacterium]|jgi:prephenate dehydratase|nr:prephenate dehydratase [Bacteroidales bacterium]MCB9029374.1 prephenate dehydratase [Bacteroidales bacterium]MDD3736513.1 prephenate dehydratase [Bacteroidales bacterium]HNT93293.1 prephenate dehydratase [Bacteroidales bacterium]HOO65910.1 prephenate dehydratase [Bacteroidales bacterium]
MKQEKESLNVAIQGVSGSFHEIAAIEYFRGQEISVIPCDTFADLFRILTVGKADYGLAAFENSVAGSILPNYELLRRSQLPVTGEICLRVIQNLVALPGQQLSDITEIHSHPMALQQCSVFIDEMRQRGVRIVEAVDTALSARIISEEKHYGSGAIASDSAAEMYSLSVLKREIEDDSLNYTRFLVISGRSRAGDNKETLSGADKAMVCFSLPHKVGSLSQVLSVLAFYQISLTRIQSMPIVGRPWEYMFHIDLIFNDYGRYRMALDAIRPLTERLETVGEFRRGLMPYETGKN